MDSKGMSGQVKKTITVLTSEPNHAEWELTIGGQVKPIADVSATVIRLTGNAGQEISKTITIIPASENHFRITNIQAEKGAENGAENGANFRHELVTEDQPDGGATYQLTVYNLKKEKGWYTDKIKIHTDSAVSPVFEIRVMGFIRDGL